MFLLRKPAAEDVRRFIAGQRDLPFSYREVGATKTIPPDWYNLDHNRVCLGKGRETFMRASEALGRWRHFELGWAAVVPQGTPMQTGSVVAVQAHTFGMWSLNACRIVYTINEQAKFGYAYGTLADHAERGEERFMIEILDDDSVWYDILAFSRPQKFIVRLGRPLARRLQRRFARDSMAVMKRLAA
ncbi:MAG TPA: DUF1990 domain-containing protein [Pyrinomonadaceae bacterium]|nr:DUF1990 domain-containing protein [Pyrinomonadaceae bacterium]